MESYQREVESYLECLETDLRKTSTEIADDARRETEEKARQIAAEAEGKIEEVSGEAKRNADTVLEEYNDAVSSFNDRAGG